MKRAWVFVLILLVKIAAAQQPVNTNIKLTYFKKKPIVEGCGHCYYLNKADMKSEHYIGIDDNVNMLININGEPHKFVLASNGKDGLDIKNTGYSISFKTTYQKQEGEEYYVFKGILTLRYHSKIVYQQRLVGDGGC